MPTLLTCTVLPTYNERQNIEPLIRRLLAANPAPYLVLVVDDDSPDGTWQVVEAIAAEVDRDAAPAGKRVALIRRTGERGLTSAIQRGIDEAMANHGAGIVTWMDCDLSMPPEDVPGLVEVVSSGKADMAVGSRWIPGGADVAHGIMARTLSWIINRYAMLMLGGQIHDYTSGFIAARVEIFEQVRLRGDYGEYCIDLLAQARHRGFRLQEVPYVCVPRTSGDSKTGANLWDYLIKGRKYVTTAWRARGVGR
ncbi:MAG: polyprenol monophosphomannose synthase [Anaerolineae bacterium]